MRSNEFCQFRIDKLSGFSKIKQLTEQVFFSIQRAFTDDDTKRDVLESNVE